MSDLNSSLNFLRQSPAHFLSIVHMDGKETPLGGMPKIYLRDIPGEDLREFIKQKVGQVTQPVELYVTHRQDVGTTHRKVSGTLSYKINLNPPPVVAEPVHQAAPVAAPPVVAPASSAPAFQGMGFPGLGFAEMVEMSTSKLRLEDVRRDLEDARETIKDQRAEIRTLTTKNHELEGKVAISEQKMEMAVMLAESKTKSIFDSEAVKRLIDNAPVLLAAVKGGQAPVSGLGMPEGLSEAKREVIDYIVEECNDIQAQFLASVLVLSNNAGFMSELQTLIKKYSTQTPSE